MLSNKLGYQVVSSGTTVIKSTPAGFFGLVVYGDGDINVYDCATAAGVSSAEVIFSKYGALSGDIVHFGGNGIAANNGITIVTTGKINVLYT